LKPSYRNERQAFKMPEEVELSRVQFVREQDGAPEQELKRRLAEMFAAGAPDNAVRRAYLAVIRHEGQQPLSVALCLRCEAGVSKALVDRVGEIFAGMFNQAMTLDIVFVDEGQEKELGKVCKPFVDREEK
jgi:hypothetical protein